MLLLCEDSIDCAECDGDVFGACECAICFCSADRKEGRKYYICSSRLGLIRWDIIQHVKAVHDKMSNTSDVHLPHELLHCASNIGKQGPPGRILGPQSLQSRCTQRSCGVRPQQHAGHSADTFAGHEGSCAATQEPPCMQPAGCQSRPLAFSCPLRAGRRTQDMHTVASKARIKAAGQVHSGIK